MKTSLSFMKFIIKPILFVPLRVPDVTLHVNIFLCAKDKKFEAFHVHTFHILNDKVVVM